MAKKKEVHGISDEILEKIRVKPEDTAARLEKIKISACPEGKPPKKGMLWCCYCGMWEKFKSKRMDGYISSPLCPKCNISINDFYIKTHNNLWPHTKR